MLVAHRLQTCPEVLANRGVAELHGIIQALLARSLLALRSARPALGESLRAGEALPLALGHVGSAAAPVLPAYAK